MRQDEFLVWQGKRKALRHVFLFEDLIIFSKARRDHYQYKSSIKVRLGPFALQPIGPAYLFIKFYNRPTFYRYTGDKTYKKYKTHKST